MTKVEYASYEAAVADFFESEGIENLTSGHPWCSSCGRGQGVWGDDNKCPGCGSDRECVEEPHFSWSPCDCCRSILGGNRVHATGYHRELDEIHEYQICEDCVYYAEFGCLDDQTMFEIEN